MNSTVHDFKEVITDQVYKTKIKFIFVITFRSNSEVIKKLDTYR